MTKVTAGARATAADLARIPYLAAVPVAARDALAARCVVRVYPRGAHLFDEGTAAEGLYLLLAGRVKVVRVSAAGREQVLHAESAGATLAEVPVFDGGAYLASAIAVEPCRALFIPRAPLLDLCRRQPDVTLGVVGVLARRLRGFAGLIEDLALRDVTARVARFLAVEAKRQGSDDVLLPGTREEIAARLGTVRELVSRSLSSLRARGVVALAGRRVRVLDRAGLADMAGE